MFALWVYVFYGLYVGLAKLHCGATPPSVMVLFNQSYIYLENDSYLWFSMWIMSNVTIIGFNRSCFFEGVPQWLGKSSSTACEGWRFVLFALHTPENPPFFVFLTFSCFICGSKCFDFDFVIFYSIKASM